MPSFVILLSPGSTADATGGLLSCELITSPQFSHEHGPRVEQGWPRGTNSPRTRPLHYEAHISPVHHKHGERIDRPRVGRNHPQMTGHEIEDP